MSHHDHEHHHHETAYPGELPYGLLLAAFKRAMVSRKLLADEDELDMSHFADVSDFDLILHHQHHEFPLFRVVRRADEATEKVIA